MKQRDIYPATQNIADTAQVSLSVKLPPGEYKLQQCSAAWNARAVANAPKTARGTATVSATLTRCRAVAFTWTRQ